MQRALSRIWTWVTSSISVNSYHYTISTSIIRSLLNISQLLHITTDMTVYVFVWMYIYIYRYRTMTVIYTATLLPTKPSSDDDSGFKHGFGAEASLQLTRSAPSVTYDTTRLCWIDITLWDYHIPWIFFYVFPLVWWRKSWISQEYKSRIGNETLASDLDRKYIGHPVISDTLFSQILTFFQLMLMCPFKIFFKGTVNSITKTFLI